MKKILLTVLAITLLFAVSYTDGGEVAETTELPEITTEESEEDTMLSFVPSEYVIIYPSDAYKEKYLRTQ